MWGSQDIWVSNITPRFLHCDTEGSEKSEIDIGERLSVLIWFILYGEAKNIDTHLDSFNFKPLFKDQLLMKVRSLLRLVTELCKVFKVEEVYTWVSSA